MTVRIGFLGTGFMGQLAHLENYHRIADCDVAVMYEALAKPPSSVLQAQYSEASIQNSESEPFLEQRLIHILTPDFCILTSLLQTPRRGFARGSYENVHIAT